MYVNLFLCGAVYWVLDNKYCQILYVEKDKIEIEQHSILSQVIVEEIQLYTQVIADSLV